MIFICSHIHTTCMNAKRSLKLIFKQIWNIILTGRYGYFWFSASVKPKYCRLRLVCTLTNHCAGRSAFLPESRVPVPQFIVRDTTSVSHFQCSCSLQNIEINNLIQCITYCNTEISGSSANHYFVKINSGRR